MKKTLLLTVLVLTGCSNAKNAKKDPWPKSIKLGDTLVYLPKGDSCSWTRDFDFGTTTAVDSLTLSCLSMNFVEKELPGIPSTYSEDNKTITYNQEPYTYKCEGDHEGDECPWIASNYIAGEDIDVSNLKKATKTPKDTPTYILNCPYNMRMLWPSNRETADAIGSDDLEHKGRAEWQANHTYCIPDKIAK